MASDQELEEIKATFNRQGEIMTDLIIRITALERLLFGKNIIKEEEYTGEIEKAVKEVVALVENTIKKITEKNAVEKELS